MRISHIMVTHSGRVRGHNEDALGASDRSVADCLAEAQGRREGKLQLPALLVVSDGLGGANAGEVASRMVVEQLISAGRERAGARGEGECDDMGWLRTIVEAAHREVREAAMADPEREGMGATLSAAWLRGRHLVFAHVGDSRIYRWRKGELTQLTDDQTEVWKRWKAGELTFDQMLAHPERHIVDQVVGGEASEALVIQTGSSRVRPGDRLLLCSDGLTDGLRDAAVNEHLSCDQPLEAIANDLLEASLEASGKDNISFVLARLEATLSFRRVASTASELLGRG